MNDASERPRQQVMTLGLTFELSESTATRRLGRLAPSAAGNGNILSSVCSVSRHRIYHTALRQSTLHLPDTIKASFGPHVTNPGMLLIRTVLNNSRLERDQWGREFELSYERLRWQLCSGQLLMQHGMKSELNTPVVGDKRDNNAVIVELSSINSGLFCGEWCINIAPPSGRHSR